MFDVFISAGHVSALKRKYDDEDPELLERMN